MTNATVSHYEVTNTKTGVTKSYKTGNEPRKACDAMDRKYGSVISRRRAIWVDA